MLKSVASIKHNYFFLMKSSIILLKPMATYLSFVPVNYHSHTMHVDSLFNNSMQARLKLLIKA